MTIERFSPLRHGSNACRTTHPFQKLQDEATQGQVLRLEMCFFWQYFVNIHLYIYVTIAN